MYHHACRLLEYDQVDVLIKDGQRERLWLGDRVCGLRDVNIDALTSLDWLVGPGGLAADPDVTAFDQTLNTRPGMVWEYRDKEQVEALSGVLVLDREGHQAALRARFGSGSFRRER
jgi:hypothetical protein